MKNVPIDEVHEFERKFLAKLEESYRTEVLDSLKAGIIDDNIMSKLKEVAAMLASSY